MQRQSNRLQQISVQRKGGQEPGCKGRRTLPPRGSLLDSSGGAILQQKAQ